MHRKPIKMNPLLLPILWVAVWANMLGRKYKIIRENFKKLPKGCLILSNHMSFEDMKLLIKFLKPRRSYYLSSIDEFIGKESCITVENGTLLIYTSKENYQNHLTRQK